MGSTINEFEVDYNDKLLCFCFFFFQTMPTSVIHKHLFL